MFCNRSSLMNSRASGFSVREPRSSGRILAQGARRREIMRHGSSTTKTPRHKERKKENSLSSDPCQSHRATAANRATWYKGTVCRASCPGLPVCCPSWCFCVLVVGWLISSHLPSPGNRRSHRPAWTFTVAADSGPCDSPLIVRRGVRPSSPSIRTRQLSCEYVPPSGGPLTPVPESYPNRRYYDSAP